MILGLPPWPSSPFESFYRVPVWNYSFNRFPSPLSALKSCKYMNVFSNCISHPKLAFPELLSGEKESVDKASFGVKNTALELVFFLISLRGVWLCLSKFQAEISLSCSWNINWETGEMIGFFCLLLFLIISQILFQCSIFEVAVCPGKKSLEHMWGFVGILTNEKNIFLGKCLCFPQEWDILMLLDQRRWPEPHHPAR